MTMHVGTHIDALGHFSIGGKLYNGLNAATWCPIGGSNASASSTCRR
jgi:Predicted metal-dependent hydrolase